MQDGKQTFSPKSLLFLVGILLLVFINTIVYERAQERTKGIDGALVATNLSATVIASLPDMEVIFPKNKTYSLGYNMYVVVIAENVSSLPIDDIYYNLDDETNTSFFTSQINDTYYTYLNASVGDHTLNVFANNTANELNQSQINFAINESIRYEVNWSRYYSSPTNLSHYNDTTFQDIANLSLEIPSFGKIEFLEVINITDFNSTEDVIDFDSFIGIDNLTIFINSTIFTNLIGRITTLYFYNVTFENVTILHDDEECLPTICIATSQTDQTLMVNVSSFSKYEVVEGGSGGSGSSGSGSAGGGGQSSGGDAGGERGSTSASFDMDAYVEQTEVITRIGKLFITWNGEEYTARIGKPSPYTVLVDFTSLGLKMTLGKGQSMTIDLDFDGEPDVRISIDDLNSNTITITLAALHKTEKPQAVIEKRPEEPTKEAQENLEKITKALLNKDLLGITLLIILSIAFIVYERKTQIKKGSRQRKHF